MNFLAKPVWREMSRSHFSLGSGKVQVKQQKNNLFRMGSFSLFHLWGSKLSSPHLEAGWCDPLPCPQPFSRGRHSCLLVCVWDRASLRGWRRRFAFLLFADVSTLRLLWGQQGIRWWVGAVDTGAWVDIPLLTRWSLVSSSAKWEWSKQPPQALRVDVRARTLELLPGFRSQQLCHCWEHNLGRLLHFWASFL